MTSGEAESSQLRSPRPDRPVAGGSCERYGNFSTFDTFIVTICLYIYIYIDYINVTLYLCGLQEVRYTPDTHI